MPSVRVRENEYFDAALRRFKRACEKAGVLTELRRREFYEKPTQERKRKKAAAVKRHLKRLSRENMRGWAAALPRAPRQRLRPRALIEAGSFDVSVSLKERITDDMKAAMRAGEKERLGVIRMITSAIKQREVDERIVLDDAQVLSVLEKMIKQRKESMAQFQAGNRQDLVDKETAEIALLQSYMPSRLSDAEIDALIAEAIARHRRRQHQGHGQGDGRHQGEGAGPRRHGRRRRQNQSQARRLTQVRSMAGRIPQPFIDEIVARSDIVEIIGARVALKKSGREYKACCPFHSEKTPSFWVSPDKQFYHCFGCGAHGTVVGFLMQYEKLGFLDAVADLAQRAGLELPREAQGGARPRRRRSVRAHDARRRDSSSRISRTPRAHASYLGAARHRRGDGRQICAGLRARLLECAAEPLRNRRGGAPPAAAGRTDHRARGGSARAAGEHRPDSTIASGTG